MSTRAIILAAGSGSRLMPYTEKRPKGMVNFAGIPLLERQVATLRSNGISNITVVGGHRAWMLERLGCPLIINENHAQTNMVASLYKARDLFDGAGDLIICYADILFEPRILDKLHQAKGDISVVADRNWLQLWGLRMENPLLDAESFKISNDGNIIELGRKSSNIAEIRGQYVGILKVAPASQTKFFDLYEALNPASLYEGQTFANMYMTGYLQMLAEQGWQLMPAWIENGWIEIDSVSDLNTYYNMFNNGSLRTILDLDALGGVREPWCHIDAEATQFISERLSNVDAHFARKGLFSTSDFVRGLVSEIAPGTEVIKIVDKLSRKIEIAGKLYSYYELDTFLPVADSPIVETEMAEALMAWMLLHAMRFDDLRYVNTVTKALNADFRKIHALPNRSPIDDWCASAISILTSRLF